MTDIETHPLEPFVPQQAKLLMLGSFPPPKARWKMDFYYPNFQNDMWKIYGLIFFQDSHYFLDRENKQFKEQMLKDFLNELGIAIFDTAYQIRRLKDNASDQFLEIVTPTDMFLLLKKIPYCRDIMTTGDKATETLLKSMNASVHTKVKMGTVVDLQFDNKDIRIHRMPSSSRAYPLALEKKAEYYRELFQSIGLI
ncbi:uracil-DNA glycosylase family protein [Acinetobacter sp. Ver3]|uniref:uracil-DNA glycosylase family protein n=1 Tax=Acinetobacter sp. Ver3 TaxID=466088 RepID=UPI000453A1DD|nr:uracil-DNA glycosylase family protein [Acinetobacter sp. Ver3]EZQ06622.1 DNA glycosylase [Acinetobacter sp. Ver3]